MTEARRSCGASSSHSTPNAEALGWRPRHRTRCSAGREPDFARHYRRPPDRPSHRATAPRTTLAPYSPFSLRRDSADSRMQPNRLAAPLERCLRPSLGCGSNVRTGQLFAERHLASAQAAPPRAITADRERAGHSGSQSRRRVATAAEGDVKPIPLSSNAAHEPPPPRRDKRPDQPKITDGRATAVENLVGGLASAWHPRRRRSHLGRVCAWQPHRAMPAPGRLRHALRNATPSM